METSANQQAASGLPVSASGRHPLQTMDATCAIPAKSSGIVSLTVQFIILVLSALVAIFFFYHIGGYEYLGWKRNSTSTATEESFSSSLNDELIVLPYSEFDQIENETLIRRKREDAYDLLEGSGELDDDLKNSTLMYDDINEQLPNTTIYLEFLDSEIDMLELIRVSTLVYLVMCAAWFLCIVILVVAIKTEIPDMVVINMTVVLIAILYLFVHVIFICILFYLQNAYNRTLSTRTTLITLGTIAAFLFIILFGVFSIIQDIAFYNYICYINDSSGCLCLSLFTSWIKSLGSQRRSPHEYALAENTHAPANNANTTLHPNTNPNPTNDNNARIPYIDDGTPIQSFSHF